MSSRPLVLVGKTVSVRVAASEPTYFTDAHRRWIGGTGVVHAVVPAQPRDNPLIKVKFADEQVVFFRLSDLEVHHDESTGTAHRHGERGSHLPDAE